MLKELRITIRRLAMQPTFTVAAIATLSVGVGATTAIFSIVNATLLRPLVYPQSEDLYTLNTTLVDGRWSSGRVTGAYVAAINESAPSVQAVAVRNEEDVIVTDEGENRQVLVHLVTEGFFDLFGLPMAEGRAFTQQDQYTRVAVIAHRIWDEVFGRDPAAVGRTLNLATSPVTIVGVAPPDFDVPQRTDVWISTRLSPVSVAHSFQGYLRAHAGTNPARVRSELASVMAGLSTAYPQAASGRAFVVSPLVTAIVGDLGPILVLVLAGSIMLLLLGSLNVATLVLARGAAQTREVAVRVALGAGRWSIVRRFLTESCVLATAGTLAGLFLAYVGVRLLLIFGAAELPRLDQVPFDARVLLVAVATLIATAVLVGLVPVGRLASPDIRNLLTVSGRSVTGAQSTQRVLSGLVVAEIALANHARFGCRVVGAELRQPLRGSPRIRGRGATRVHSVALGIPLDATAGDHSRARWSSHARPQPATPHRDAADLAREADRPSSGVRADRRRGVGEHAAPARRLGIGVLCWGSGGALRPGPSGHGVPSASESGLLPGDGYPAARRAWIRGCGRFFRCHRERDVHPSVLAA